ncbi:hypothetical protein [Ralstonia pseudosolanacearum]|uniref:hypothetical protein n=1 Tax=Ralstonia pseudosolanacearum TaxID=1310165 RepID=UPI002675C881|nr:hypothetical protein [Ralstonia pseudosolanacearum]MDO3560915.1 hypothetical protein [Ralstonia pseudosolanacearum]MDO3572452.1 hypothetical protein [Ralstonia pseudosolanacearum]MDO3619197.1 hypothetical protein [Ralstonia pseudosolanacearum]
MDCSTVASLAIALNRSPEALLEQLHEAGLSHSTPEAPIVEADKLALLEYFKRQHGATEGGTSTASPRIHVVVVRKRTAAVLNRMSEAKRAIDGAEAEHPPVFVSRHTYKLIRRNGVVVSFESDEPALVPCSAQRATVLLDALSPAMSARAQHVRRVVLDFLRKVLAATPLGAVRCKMLAALAGTRVAQDRMSCLLAERNASVHPAFAPPRVMA